MKGLSLLAHPPLVRLSELQQDSLGVRGLKRHVPSLIASSTLASVQGSQKGHFYFPDWQGDFTFLARGHPSWEHLGRCGRQRSIEEKVFGLQVRRQVG